ncbi:hypothetical protein D3C87_1388470 [compost metagenome]
MPPGDGKHSTSGLFSNTPAKEAIRVGFDYFKGNLNLSSATAKFSEHEYHLHVVELHNSGPSTKTSLAALVGFCSILMGKPVQEQMVVLGDMTLGDVVNPVEDLAGSLQLAMESGYCCRWRLHRIFQPYRRRSSPSFKSAFMLIRWMLSTRH